MTYYNGALSIIETLQEQGYTAYFAGGWVRDLLLGHTSDDIDIVTNASVEEIKDLFNKTIPVGIQFGIMVVVIDDHQYEVATFRKEDGYQDGRRPSSVKPASPKEDAQRRDLTINGLFYDPKTKEIFDYVEGQIDIKNKLIKAIGNADLRFKEDRLRMLRAIRYACRFSFKIDPITYTAIKKHSSELFPAVAIERVWQEFNKIAAYPHFGKAMLMLKESSLLEVIFPELKELTTKMLEKRVDPIPGLPKTTPTIAKIILLFGDMSVDDLLKIFKRMKVSNKEIAFATYLAQLMEILRNKVELSRFQLTHLYANIHFQLCFEIVRTLPFPPNEIEKHEKMHISLEKHVRRVVEKKPLLTSTMLLELNVKPGVEMGKLIQRGEKIAIEENLLDSEPVLLKLGLINFDNEKS
ncbi:MAG: CCA tRNA nucleotidyltransferase [Rhabdochlamydiaceae bacterium]|nr:CCA tRNA nucleotidyltransferase [Candidatus Amphrikana amoebophyrae]